MEDEFNTFEMIPDLETELQYSFTLRGIQKQILKEWKTLKQVIPDHLDEVEKFEKLLMYYYGE